MATDHYAIGDTVEVRDGHGQWHTATVAGPITTTRRGRGYAYAIPVHYQGRLVRWPAQDVRRPTAGRGDPVSTIRTAADTIRARLDALPERAQSEWACHLEIVWAPRGTPIAQALAWRYDTDRHAIGALIATLASPHVAAALADLLEAQDAAERAAFSGQVLPPEWRQLLERRDRAIYALADAITRRSET